MPDSSKQDGDRTPRSSNRNVSNSTNNNSSAIGYDIYIIHMCLTFVLCLGLIGLENGLLSSSAVLIITINLLFEIVVAFLMRRYRYRVD